MKKLATLLIALVFFGCSKNSGDKPDDPPVVIEHKIVGKWQYAAFMDDVAPFEWEYVENGDILNFKPDGTYEVYYADPNYSNETCSESLTYTILEYQDASFINYYCEGEFLKDIEFYINENDELMFPSPLQLDKYVRISE